MSVVLKREMKKIIEIDEKECIGCGSCVEICPNKILYLDEGMCKVKDEKKCDKSKGCENVCPTGAIKIH